MQLGLEMPKCLPWMTERAWVHACMGWVKPEWRAQMNPLVPPFQIGDIVGKGFIDRPFDIGMRYRVAGMYYSGSGNGWQATIALGEQPVRSQYIAEEYETVSTARICLVARHEDYELASRSKPL